MAETNPKKIVFVYDCIYPFVMGGAERRFYELGRQLIRMGYEVHWYGMKFWDEPGTFNHDGIILHGLCKARPVYTKNGRRSITQALIFGLSAFKLMRVDFDVIDCCGFPYFSLFPAKISAILKRKPLISTWHEVWGKRYWNEYLGPIGIFGYMIERAVSKLPNTIVATSNHTAELLERELNVNGALVVVPNGINFEDIRRVIPSKQKSDIIFVGRLVEFKNIDYIIKALEILNSKGITLDLAIIGDGPYKNILKKLARSLNIDKQIVWHGFIKDSSEVYAHMKASKVFAFPSKREGFGIVAIEANACGLPVVTLDHNGNAARQLISKRNGYLFEGNEEDLAINLLKCLQNWDNLSKTSQKFAENFSWDIIGNNIARVYLS